MTMGDVKYQSLVMTRDSADFLKWMKKAADINLYLAQNRFCCVRDVEEKKGRNGEDKTEQYSSLLVELVRKKKILSSELYERKLPAFLEQLNGRNEKIAANFPYHKEYEYKPYDKLILGEGGSAYLGAQPLRLHPLYGVPYIPASVIKGTLRSVWIMERYGGVEGKAEDLEQLFGKTGEGSTQMEGKLRFVDIFPKKFQLGLDVQTVHYERYYKQPVGWPTDDQNTIPAAFMCLRQAEFSILIGCCDKEVWERWKTDLDLVMECMIKQYGIGAKTAIGYGIGV